MSIAQTPTVQPPAADPGSVSFATLVGLRDGADPGQWGRVRAAQLRAARDLAPILLGANLIGAGVTASLFTGLAPGWMLAAWGALAAAASLAVAFRRLRAAPAEGGFVGLRELRDTALEGLGLAAVWSVPATLFAEPGTAAAALALWSVLSALMAAAAVAMAPLALPTLIFLGGVGASVAARLALDGAGAAAAATLLFAGLLGVACVNRARALVVIHAGQLALAERDETVSMLLREFEEHGADWLWETDAAKRVVRASPRFAAACGLDPGRMDGLPLLQLLAGPAWESGAFPAGLRDLAERLNARQSFRGLRLPVPVDGRERWWEVAASPRLDGDGRFAGFRGVGSDVTEQRASADKINRLARFDTLTGLPNRLQVNEALARAVADADQWGGRCAFMMIDLDRFKAVNDTLGHPVGDRLLGRVSERLGRLMGRGQMCGRLGGDEFAVVVSDARDAHAVEQLAGRIIETLSRPYEVDGHTLLIGASVGLAVGPRDGRTADTLVRSADLALYRSKDGGGGAVNLYEPRLHADAEERRRLELALRQALELGQMHIHYQPVVDMGSGRLTGFEALLRWTHPEQGVVPPSKFLALAEEARLIAPIGAWVLRTACEEAARWPSDLRVAVNVSPDELRDPNFAATVTSALAAGGLSAGRLELEVTENVFLREDAGAVRVLERLLDLGVRLSLDDFGVGHSSLRQFNRTRFSSVKIDRSVVGNAAEGGREAVAIIRAAVALARSLGMMTTAEGVETEAGRAVARDLGCDRAQGHLFGRPMPVEEARRLADGRRWDDSAAA